MSWTNRWIQCKSFCFYESLASCRISSDDLYEIRIIFKKYSTYIPHFRSLYLCVTNLNDKMVEQLQTVIDLQKLLDNFIIKHRNNKLYFQWEWHEIIFWHDHYSKRSNDWSIINFNLSLAERIRFLMVLVFINSY
jgi:hypothetical protein